MSEAFDTTNYRAISVIGRQFHHKPSGTTYQSACVVIFFADGSKSETILPPEYGYGSAWEARASQECFGKDGSYYGILWRTCQMKKIPLHTELVEVSAWKRLHQKGKGWPMLTPEQQTLRAEESKERDFAYMRMIARLADTAKRHCKYDAYSYLCQVIESWED
jgi:hypothetical protein